MNREKLFWAGIKALIEDEHGKVLLLKSPGWKERGIGAHWDIPGGRIEEGQSIDQVLKREVAEETGITDIENADFYTAVISNHEIPFEGRTLGLVLMVYRVNIPAGSKIKLSPEHTEYEWVTKTEAAKRLTHKYPSEFTQKLALDK